MAEKASVIFKRLPKIVLDPQTINYFGGNGRNNVHIHLYYINNKYHTRITHSIYIYFLLTMCIINILLFSDRTVLVIVS